MTSSIVRSCSAAESRYVETSRRGSTTTARPRGRVADQVRRLRQALQVVLLEDHQRPSRREATWRPAEREWSDEADPGGGRRRPSAVAAPASVLAHTEPDVVAVPAGAASTINLKPTHGCGESPTVAVRIRAPFPDATAGARRGVDGHGHARRCGQHACSSGPAACCPPTRRVPSPSSSPPRTRPGVLLTFPAIQVCENGEELAWISGDPADEYPAPRVLVLPPGSEPATTIDDVALDAPGRDQLVAVVDVDNPERDDDDDRTHRPPSRRPRRPRWPPPSPCRPSRPPRRRRRRKRPRQRRPLQRARLRRRRPATPTTATAAARPVRSSSVRLAVAALGAGAALVARRRST